MAINTFIYPRTMSIYRPNDQLSEAGGAGQGQSSQFGGTGSYWGASREVAEDAHLPGLTLVQADVPCSIQGTAGKSSGTGELPSDAPGPSRWRFFTPLGSCPKGTIQTRDVLIDDEGARYQVSTPYWNSLGYRAETIRLED